MKTQEILVGAGALGMRQPAVGSGCNRRLPTTDCHQKNQKHITELIVCVAMR